MRGRNLLRMLHSPQAALESYYPRVKKLRHRSGKYVFLAAMPKSGSSFLSHALCTALGYRHSYLAFAYENIEQEIYLPRLLETYGQGTVVQQHIKGNGPNLSTFRRFGIRPTIQTRNIFDIIVSVRDHLLRERLDNIPSLIVPDDYASLPEERQLDIVTTMFGPWLVSFYVSWRTAEEVHGHEVMWLRYEDCISDWKAAIIKVAAFHSLADSVVDVEKALEVSRLNPWSRINKGVIGRGEELLNGRQKAVLRQMASYYPGVDFGPVGL